MPLYSIHHRTTYRYAEMVAMSHQALHLEPMTTETQECLSFTVEAQPRPQEIRGHTDYFGNRVHLLTLTEPHRELHLETRSTVTVTPARGREKAGGMTSAEVSAWLEEATEPKAHQAWQFLYASPLAPRLPAVADFARKFFGGGRAVMDGTRALCAAIHAQFKFDPTATNPATPLGQIFQLKRGVCQDFAHLAVAGLRAAGLPGRYVSGYLLTEPPAGQPRLAGVDASHAWASVYLPGAGWVDFDPTNNCFCDERHITVAWGRDYSDVSPMRGTVVGGGAHMIALGVTVAPAG